MKWTALAGAVLAVIMMCACGGGTGLPPVPATRMKAKETSQKITTENIPFQVLKETWRADRKLDLELLVSPNASQKDVMVLGERMLQKFSGRINILTIFDSEVAWKRQADLNYPEEELFRHWLVTYDGEKLNWVAKGRPESP